jgi:hypothetical protein
MAQRVEIQFIDDIDGTKADGTVRFGIDGTQYEIDLSAANADKLASALSPYIEAGRRVNGSRRHDLSPPPGRHDQSAVREWARSQGLRVSGRGRIPAEILTRYRAAH